MCSTVHFPVRCEGKMPIKERCRAIAHAGHLYPIG